MSHTSWKLNCSWKCSWSWSSCLSSCWAFVAVAGVILILRPGESVDIERKSNHYYGNASMKLLRFRDFEPRQLNVDSSYLHNSRNTRKSDSGTGREGRGFHFHSTDSDLSVELEFIVPFFKVPVKRGMLLARKAMRSLLNLQAGALINTVVVVAAGAIIAAVVRLLLAPLVISSFNNAYKSEDLDIPIANSAKARRSRMRSLTDVVETQLSEHNIDMSACAQRYICGYLQRNAAELRNSATQDTSINSHAYLLDAFANSQWLDTYLNGTAVFDAIWAARGNHNCDFTYSSCQWQLNMKWLQAWPRFLQYFNG